MDIEKLSFRRATPSDVEVVAPFIYASGPDAFEYVFNDSKSIKGIDFIKYAFEKKSGELTYFKHICAVYNDEVIGIGAIWSGKMGFTDLLSNLKNILSFYGIVKGIPVLIRGLKFENLVRPPKKNEYVLAHLGIKSGLRGKGVGKRLIHHLLNSVHPKKNEKVVLDVSFINPKAQQLYETLGFAVTNTNNSTLRRKSLSINVPGHFRMELESI